MPKGSDDLKDVGKAGVVVTATATGVVSGAEVGAKIGVALGTVCICGVRAPGTMGAVIGGVAGLATGLAVADNM